MSKQDGGLKERTDCGCNFQVLSLGNTLPRFTKSGSTDTMITLCCPAQCDQPAFWDLHVRTQSSALGEPTRSEAICRDMGSLRTAAGVSLLRFRMRYLSPKWSCITMTHWTQVSDSANFVRLRALAAGSDGLVHLMIF